MLTSTVCQPPMPADVIANALLGKGIGNILFPRTVGFPHCWLCSYCNVSPTQNVVWSYTRYSSQCYIGAIAIPSTSSWTTTKQQCWTNKNVEYQWENGFIVWDYSPLFTNQLQKRKNSKLEMFQVMIPKYYWEYRSQLLALDNYYHCCLILLV